MRIFLITIGSRDDVQPFAAIGAQLKFSGHDVHMAADTGFSQMIAAEGLTHHPLPLDFQGIIQDPEMQAALTSFSGKLKAYRLASEIMNKQFSAMWQVGLDIEPDVILYHFKGAIGPYLGRRLKVPAWPVMLQPGFVPLAPDMSQTDKQVGYAFSVPGPFTPPQKLKKFLSEGERPVFVGFGSMPEINHERINTALVGALEKTGLRAVVATGWGGIGELSTNPKVHTLDTAPHAWLFPRVAAVVHHGGFGTTHEGLRWGRPSVICPFFADQPFFVRQVARLGAGSEPIPQKATHGRQTGSRT